MHETEKFPDISLKLWLKLKYKIPRQLSDLEFFCNSLTFPLREETLKTLSFLCIQEAL